MRSYRQYCALAKALDLVGDRWTLLIVRELLSRGPSRYTDLLGGLPGVATNLLSKRLRDLERSGILRREEAPPPVATALFELTERGRALEPALRELGRWGAPFLQQADRRDRFRVHWLSLLARQHLKDQRPDLPTVSIQIQNGKEAMVIEAGGGQLRTRPGSAEVADATLVGPPPLLAGVLAGRLDLAAARRAGLEFRGDSKALERLLPRTADAGAPRPAPR